MLRHDPVVGFVGPPRQLRVAEAVTVLDLEDADLLCTDPRLERGT